MLHHFYACFRYRTCKFLRKPNNERFILFRSLMIICIKILQVKDLQFWSLEIPNNVTYDLYKDTPKGFYHGKNEKFIMFKPLLWIFLINNTLNISVVFEILQV